MKQFTDSNVIAAAHRGNDLAQQALDQSGYGETAQQGDVAEIALGVAEELFAEFSDEAGIVCEPFGDHADSDLQFDDPWGVLSDDDVIDDDDLADLFPLDEYDEAA
jgi:hypothetical protein